MAKHCKKCGENIEGLTRCPKCGKKNRSKKTVVIITIFLIVIMGGVALYNQNPQIIENMFKNTKKTMTASLDTFSNNVSNEKSNYMNEIITKDNYEEVMNRLEKEIKDDEELYYLSYSILYYTFKDGMASAFTGTSDENAMYVNIYGKTLKQLINEGKQLMKDNNMTIEKFKEQIEELSNVTNQANT